MSKFELVFLILGALNECEILAIGLEMSKIVKVCSEFDTWFFIFSDFGDINKMKIPILVKFPQKRTREKQCQDSGNIRGLKMSK